MDSSIYLASLFIFGYEFTLSLLFVGNLLHAFLTYKVTAWWKHLFNFSMFSIMITASYYMFLFSGGVIGFINLTSTFSYLLVIGTYYLINTLIVSIYFLSSSSTSSSLFSIFKEIGQETIANYIITLALAFVLAILLQSNPIFGTFIFTFVIILASLAFIKYFNLYEQMTNDKIYQEQILHSLPIGIITVDNRTSDYFLNHTAKTLLDSDENKIKFLTNKDQSNNEYFWSIFSSKKGCHNVKVTYKTNENNYLFLVSQSPLYDQHKNTIGRNFYFIDITDTDDLEKRMHQSEKLAMLGELAAGAAHEIRNPLAVIHGFMTLMKDSFTVVEQEKYYIPLMLNEFGRINAIIEEMLMLAKPGSPQFKEVSVNDLFSEIPDFYKQSSTKNQLQFKINLDSTTLLLDEKQIKQVMYNLIRNSSDAMNGNGTITFYSKLDKVYYHLFVQDTGPGIPKDIQKSIFDPFLTTKETGTGLGLTIVQRIIENHHGNIQLFSSSEEGTTFVISLPLLKK
ncbi:ATP-binding protein [Anaerobacillus alkaliphilus]|nr:ATP-binding protein [Anaerobacillus alkaliphilus]